MSTHRRLFSAAAIISLSASLCSAQGITSAHSGLLHYFEGTVTIDGATIESKVGKFSEIKENSILRTAQGRAEILLTPGVYLRVGENSAIKMLDNRLLSTRVEFLSGTALVESDDPEVSVKDPAVTIVYKDYQVQPLKYGIFELSSDPSQMKVFKGTANVTAGTIKQVIKEGRLVSFSAALVSEKFDEKQADDLYLWARDRSGALSAANLSSARSLSQGGYSLNNLYMGGMYPGLGFSSGMVGGWYFNQGLGMYAYMPYGGTFYSPFGYGIFSPTTIYTYYSPSGSTWYGGSGARSTTFVPQPVNSLIGATRSPVATGAPGRLTGNLPMAGSSSFSNSMSRGGFTSGLARANAGESRVSSPSFSAASNNSGFSGFGTGAGASTSGGFSGASMSAGGAASGGRSAAPAGGGRAR
jgi:hypothetical protein